MSAFAKDFLSVTRNMSAKDLGGRIASGGGLKFMTEGTHKVRVTGVDRNGLAQNKVTIKYENERGQEHADFLFLCERNKKTGHQEFSRRFASTLGMLIPSEEAYDAFIAEVQADNAVVLDNLIGLCGEITLARGKGYGPAEAQQDGTYVVRNTQRPEETYCGRSIDEARGNAEAAGLKKAYVNVTGYKSTDAEANIEKFAAALAASRKPAAKPAATFPFGRMAV